MYNPLVSVIVATYRREDSLRKALLSLQNQTYDNYEVVLVDDNGCKEWCDKVRNIANELVDLNIRLIVNDSNQGSAKARNIGIDAAKGDYITFLDDDDIYLPRKIEKQVEGMVISNADYGITDLNLYNEQDEIIDKRIRSYIKIADQNELLRYHLREHMTGTDTFMFKSEYLHKIGGFQGVDVGDEFYLMKDAILANGKFHYDNHCYIKAYIHVGENKGLSSGDSKIIGENKLFEEKKKYFKYLCKDDIRYIEMRHYAVLAFTELKRQKWILFFKYASISFLTSPIDCLKMYIEHK